jgi:hypothetical protein
MPGAPGRCARRQMGLCLGTRGTSTEAKRSMGEGQVMLRHRIYEDEHEACSNAIPTKVGIRQFRRYHWTPGYRLGRCTIR